jgi:hypothetical protein
VKIDWERWVGVRGAAVLGGVVLALAGLYFFRYSIEHGLIPPWLRVVVGTLLGLGCMLCAEWKARARYAVTADALAGAGVVILYAAFWAARVLYDLVGTEIAFVLMVSVTGACAALSYRHVSLVIALIGLIGGFLTPFMLSTGEDRPIALFAYILLLDACLLFMAHRRGWPLLALLSLVGTLLYQALWISQQMDPGELAIALCVLGVFALAYAFAARDAPADTRRQWLITQGGSALFPFAFAFYFALHGEFGSDFAPIAILLALLSTSASWLGREQKRPWLGLGAATGSVAVFAVWLLRHRLDAALAWETAGLAVLLGLVFHAFVEIDREPAGTEGPAPAAMVAALGLLALLAAASVGASGVGLWPWLAGWLALAGLLYRHGGFPRRGALQVAAAFGVGLGLALYQGSRGSDPAAPSFAVFGSELVAIAIAAQTIAMLRARGAGRRWAEHAAGVFPAVMLLYLALDPRFDVAPLLTLGATLVLGFLAVLVATRLGSGRWLFAATALTALAHSAWTFDHPGLAHAVGEAANGLGIQTAAVLLFTFWPFAISARFRTRRWAWWAVALAGPAWFPSLKSLYETCFGDGAIGLLPIFLGSLSLAAAWRATRIWSVEDPLRKSNLAWFLGVALAFATVAIPLQLEKEWITLGWALEGLAVTALWKRLDHPGLKYVGLALLAGVTIRLVANEAVLGYYPRPSWRVVNWLLYTYLVPAGALIGTAMILRDEEIPRARPWERGLYRRGLPVAAIAAGIAAIVVIFVWVNLAIADWFSTGPSLRVSFERLPARDLATSIAWALYALVLLAVGVRGRSRGLRWLSLGLMMVTVAKVFLHDLGELEDLYRVASLLGLAISLIAISLAYQRFVVPSAEPEER